MEIGEGGGLVRWGGKEVSFRFFLIIFRLPAFRSPKRSLGALKAGLASRMQYKKKVN